MTEQVFVSSNFCIQIWNKIMSFTCLFCMTVFFEYDSINNNTIPNRSFSHMFSFRILYCLYPCIFLFQSIDHKWKPSPNSFNW